MFNNLHVVKKEGVECFLCEKDFQQELYWSFDSKREAYAEITLQRLKSAYQSAWLLTDEEFDAIEWWANLDVDTAFSYESEFRRGFLSPRIDEILKIYRNELLDNPNG